MPAQYNEVSHKPAGHYTFWKLGTRWPYYSAYHPCLNFSEKYSTLALSLCWVLENQELDDRESFHCGNPDMFRASTEWFFIAFICILSVIGRSPFVLIITKWFPSLQHADAVTLLKRLNLSVTVYQYQKAQAQYLGDTPIERLIKNKSFFLKKN